MQAQGGSMQLRSRQPREFGADLGGSPGMQTWGAPARGPVANAWGVSQQAPNPVVAAFNDAWGEPGSGARVYDEKPKEKPLSPKDRYFVMLVVAATFCLHADQGLAAPNLTAIAEDFGFEPAQRDRYLGGMVQLAFFIFGGVASVLIGPVVEKYPRKQLYSTLIAAGVGPSLLMWLCPGGFFGFLLFFLARGMSGVAIGASFPILYSILGDMFPPSQRTLVTMLVTTATAAGVGIGQGIAGFLGPAWGWRTPYVVFACGSFAFTGLLQPTPEPPRRVREEAQSKVSNAGIAGWGVSANAAPELDYSGILRVLKTPTNKFLFMNGLPGQVGWSVLQTFMIDFLHMEHGMSVQAATGLMAIFGIGALGWSIGGGSLGQLLFNTRGKASVPQLLAAIYVVAPLPVIGLVNFNVSSGSSFSFFGALLALFGGVSAAGGPNIKALLMNVNPSNRRATVFGAFTLCDHVGKGLGPSLVCVLMAVFGRQMAFTLTFALWWVCAAICMQVAGCIDRDVFLCEQEEPTEQRDDV